MLPTQARLRTNRDFRLAYSRGRSYPHALVVLHVRRRPVVAAATSMRVGFVVGKKLGGAVARNRIKRRLREIVRPQLPAMRRGSIDIVFVARAGAGGATFAALSAAVSAVLDRAGLTRVGPGRDPLEGAGQARA